MDRRKIDDVEAHRFGVVDARQAVAKGRPAIGAALSRTGKKFIPGGGTRGDPIDRYAWRRRVLRRAGTRGVGRHQDFKLARVREAVNLGVLARAHPFGEFPQTFRVGAAGALGGGGEERRALQCFAHQIGHAGFEFGGKLVLPSTENVRPGFHRVFIGRVFVDGKHPPPTIVIDVFHRGFVPARLADHAPFQGRRDDVMTVLENIGLYHDVLPDDALDRVTASIDEWLQVLDDGGGELTRHRSINRNPRSAKGQIPLGGSRARRVSRNLSKTAASKARG